MVGYQILNIQEIKPARNLSSAGTIFFVPMIFTYPSARYFFPDAAGTSALQYIQKGIWHCRIEQLSGCYYATGVTISVYKYRKLVSIIQVFRMDAYRLSRELFGVTYKFANGCVDHSSMIFGYSSWLGHDARSGADGNDPSQCRHLSRSPFSISFICHLRNSRQLEGEPSRVPATDQSKRRQTAELRRLTLSLRRIDS